MPLYGRSRSERQSLYAGAAAARGWGGTNPLSAAAEEQAAARGISGTAQVGYEMSVTELEARKKEARRALDRLEASGVTSGAEYERLAQIAQYGQEQKGNWFTKILGWLDKPGALVRYGIADMFDIGEGEKITGQAYLDVLLGRRSSLLERYGPEVVGEDARMSGSQLLTLGGVEEATTGWGRFGRGLLSVATELVTDPIVYMPTGAMAMPRHVLLSQLKTTVGRYVDDGARMLRSGWKPGTKVAGRDLAAARAAEDIVAEIPKSRALIEKELFNTLADPERALASGRRITAFQLEKPAAQRLAQIDDEAFGLAKRLVAERHLNAAAPAVAARDWAAPALADIVVNRHTPAILKGGIHLSPVPVLWNIPEHAWTIPGTRGLGKKVSRTLFGRATIAGQEATWIRKGLEKGFPNLFKAAVELGKAVDSRAYLRGILLGEIKASTVASTESAMRHAAASLGARDSLDIIHHGLADLIVNARKAGWSEREVWDVFDRVPAQLMQGLPADRVAARAEVAAILSRSLGGREAPREIVEGLIDFVGVNRQVYEKTHALMVKWGMLREGQKLDDYLPMIWSKEFQQLGMEMARRGVAVPLDTAEGQLLAEALASFYPHVAKGGTLGEAEHAAQRTFGAFSVPLGVDESAVATVDLAGLERWLAANAGNPDAAGGALYQTVQAALASAGAPRMAMIDSLNEGMGRVLRQVVEDTPGLSMPKMRGAARFRIFDTNPVTVASTYLNDVHRAVIERAVLQHLDDIGELPPALRVAHKARTSAAYAEMMRRKHPQFMKQVDTMIDRLLKEQRKAALGAAKQVVVLPGFKIPAGAASERVRAWFRSRLGVFDDASLAVRTSTDRAAGLRKSLTKLGIDDDTAGILSLAGSEAEAKSLIAEMLAEQADSAERAAREIVQAVRQGGGGLDDAARRVAELRAAEAAEVADINRLGRAVSKRLGRSQMVDTLPLTVQQVIDASETVGDVMVRLQRAAKMLPAGAAKRKLVHGTAMLLDAYHAGDVERIEQARGLLEDAFNLLDGARRAQTMPHMGEMAAGAVRRFAAPAGISASDRDALLGLVDVLERSDPADVLRMLSETPLLARTEAGRNLAADTVAATLLAHGLPDMEALRGVFEAFPGLHLYADVASLRDQAAAMSWLSQARHAALTGRRVDRHPMWDGTRIERGLRDMLGLPDSVRVEWQRIHILDEDGRVAQMWGPKFTEVTGRKGISRSDLAEELRAAGLSPDQARRGLLGGDPEHAAARLTGEARAALLADGETVGMMDEWMRRLQDHWRRRVLAAGGAADDLDWAAGRAAQFEQHLFEGGKRRWRELLKTRRAMPLGARLGRQDGSAVDAMREAAGRRVGDLLPEPSKEQLRGAHLFATEDGTAGFGISESGEIFGLWSLGEEGGGVAALLRARTHADRPGTWALIPADNEDAARLFARAGFTDQVRQADGTVRAALPAGQQVGREAARYAETLVAVSQIEEMVGRGAWQELDGLLANKPLRRLLKEQGYSTELDRLGLHVRARRVLDDPLVDEQVKRVVRSAQQVRDSGLNAATAVIAMEDVADRLRRGVISPELARSQVAREWLGNAEAFRQGFVELTTDLRTGLPLATLDGETAALRALTTQVLQQARDLGFTEFYRSARKIGQAGLEHTLLPVGEGHVLAKAYNLRGERVGMSSPNKWVAEMLEGMVGHLQMMGTPVGLELFGHAARSTVGWWKGMATVVRPTFHVRNSIGATFNNMIGGVRVRDYIWVRDKMARFRHLEGKHGTQRALDMLPVGDATIIRDALETGVLESSFARAVAHEMVAPPGLGSRMNPLSRHGPAVKIGGEAMTTVEDFYRLAAFKRWHKAGGRDMAAEMTFALHFDYRHLTRLETQIKQVVPFFVWTRRNLPLQLRVLVERPDLVQRYAHLMHGMNDQYEPNAPFDLPLPGMYTTALSIGTGVTFNGDTPFWARAILSPDLPLMDLADLDPMSPKSWLDFLQNSLGPQITAPFELASQSEYGGSVNAPAGLNEVLMGLHYLGIYNNVSDGTARVPREIRYAMELGLPMWREWTAPWETDPARRQQLGMGQDREILSPEVLRAFGIQMGKGVGLRTVTPTQTYNQSFRTQEEIREMVRDMQRQGLIPPLP